MEIHIFIKLLDTIGTLCIAYAALRVHHRVLTDRQVDGRVLGEMRREQIIGILGAVLIVTSFLIEFFINKV